MQCNQCNAINAMQCNATNEIKNHIEVIVQMQVGPTNGENDMVSESWLLSPWYPKVCEVPTAEM